MNFKKKFIGPSLPHNCVYGSMIAFQDNQSLALIGCSYYEIDNDPIAEIYQLSWNNEDNLEWTIMSQKLKYPRRNTVAMMIPNELSNCVHVT